MVTSAIPDKGILPRHFFFILDLLSCFGAGCFWALQPESLERGEPDDSWTNKKAGPRQCPVSSSLSETP